MVARARWAFQVSQGSVWETRWKTFRSFYSKFIQEIVYQISSQWPEFYRSYYQKHFGLFFPDTLYMSNSWALVNVEITKYNSAGKFILWSQIKRTLCSGVRNHPLRNLQLCPKPSAVMTTTTVSATRTSSLNSCLCPDVCSVTANVEVFCALSFNSELACVSRDMQEGCGVIWQDSSVLVATALGVYLDWISVSCRV